MRLAGTASAYPGSAINQLIPMMIHSAKRCDVRCQHHAGVLATIISFSKFPGNFGVHRTKCGDAR